MTTTGSQQTGWRSSTISFASVVERMVAARGAEIGFLDKRVPEGVPGEGGGERLTPLI